MTAENYVFSNGWTMKREGEHGKWHLRDSGGALVDTDKYRHDVISRFDLQVIKHHDPFA